MGNNNSRYCDCVQDDAIQNNAIQNNNISYSPFWIEQSEYNSKKVTTYAKHAVLRIKKIDNKNGKKTYVFLKKQKIGGCQGFYTS
jgi:hypothetical protein